MTNLFRDDPFHRPIGFWIQSAHKYLTACIDALHDDLGLSRRDWQALSTLVEAGGRTSFAALLETFTPMMTEEDLRAALSDLAGRELVAVGPMELEITAPGHALYRTAYDRQTDFRRKVMQGISDADHSTAVQVLAALAANCRSLDPAP